MYSSEKQRELTKAKVSRRKESAKIKTEIKETIKEKEMVSATKRFHSNKTDKTSAGLRKREENARSKIKEEGPAR